jgi:hypothetical protein
MNKNLLSLQKMSHQIKPNNKYRSKSPLSTTSSSSSSISNERQQQQRQLQSENHSFVSKMQNNNKHLNRSKPYSPITTTVNKNKSNSSSPSTSSNSSLTSSPTAAPSGALNTNIIAPSPVFPFDPVVLAALQKYYSALASTTQQQSLENYDSSSNFPYNSINGILSNCIQQQQQQQTNFNYIIPTSLNKCPDPNCSKCLSPSNNVNTCTLEGCNQCSNNLNVSTTSNSSNNNSLTNSPPKLVSPTQSNNHFCNWLSGGNTYCGKKFSSLDQLNEHIKSHTTAELVSDLTRYYNIRSSLLNNQQMQSSSAINNPFLSSGNQANQFHNNRFNPYSKPAPTTPNSILPHSISNQLPYLGYNNSAPNISTSQLITTPNLNFYSQLALLTNNI